MLKISILAATAALIGLLVLQVATRIPEFRLPLTQVSTAPQEPAPSVAAMRSGADGQAATPSAATSTPPQATAESGAGGNETAAAAKPVDPARIELRDDAAAQPARLLSQFGAWAARQDARIEASIEPSDETGPAPIAVDPPFLGVPLPKRSPPAPAQDAMAEIPRVPVPRSRPRPALRPAPAQVRRSASPPTMQSLLWR